MSRITNNLFEAIQKVTSGEVAEASVDKAHYCATHVEHALLGYGECISEQHAAPDENGDIAWYTVRFPTGTHKVNTEQLRIVEGKSHMHSKKMAEENIEEAEYAKATMPQKFGEAPKLKDKEKEDSSRPFEYAKATMPQKFGEAPRLKREGTEEIEESEGGIPKTAKHKQLAAKYGDPNKITRGDIITAAKEKSMKKEETEQIDELSKSTLKSYSQKATSDAGQKIAHGAQLKSQGGEDTAHGNELMYRAKKRLSNVKKADDKAFMKSEAVSNEPKMQKENVVSEGMPSSVIKHKQRLAAKTPEELHAGFKEVAQRTKKSVEDIARSTAWGHGYGKGAGKGSSHYWDKIKHLENKTNEGLDEAEKKDTSAFDWKSRVKTPQSKFEKKKISTGTVYTRKPEKEKEEKEDMKEGVTQTIVNHNDFVLEVTDNPTFKDYLEAIQSIVPATNDDIHKEIVTIATEAHKEEYVDIILESMTRKAFESKIAQLNKEGYKVTDINYVVEDSDPFVEYVAEKDGKAIQYVDTGVIVISDNK